MVVKMRRKTEKKLINIHLDRMLYDLNIMSLKKKSIILKKTRTKQPNVGAKEITKLKEHISSLESENIKLNKQLETKLDQTHFDSLMKEFKERSIFVSEFTNIINKIKNLSLINFSAKYIDNMYILPFIYQNPLTEIFSETIDYVVANSDEDGSFAECYTKLLLLKVLDDKNSENIKVKCGNYKLSEIYKIGNWKHRGMFNGLALVFKNTDESLLPLNVRIINKKCNDYQVVHDTESKNISVLGKKFDDMYLENIKEYEIGFGEAYSDDEINNLDRDVVSRRDILNEFILDVKKYIEPLSKGYTIVSEIQQVPIMELVVKSNTETQCSITQIETPYINLIINCNCYYGKGRKMSLMAISGIISNLSSSNKDVCPFCKERLLFAFKESRPMKQRLLDMSKINNRDLPATFYIKQSDTTNIMSKEAMEFLDNQTNRFLNEGNDLSDESITSEESYSDEPLEEDTD